jgi:hypothetical protein
VKTWKTSTDPNYEAKKNRVLDLYAIADSKHEPGPGDPTVVICMDEFGPLNLHPHPGQQWAPAAVGQGTQDLPRRRRRRATYTRPHGVRHLMAGYDLSTDKLYAHVVKRKNRTTFLAFCRYLRSLHPPEIGPFPLWWRVGHIPRVPELGRNRRWDRHGGHSPRSTKPRR